MISNGLQNGNITNNTITEELEFVQIKNIARTYSGGTPKKSHPEYYGGSIPWVKSGELNGGIVNRAEEYITEEGLQKSSAKWVPADSILIAMYGATAGKVALLKITATINQAILALIPKEKEDLQYIFYSLTKVIEETLISHSQGSGQPNLNGDIIKNISIPFPSSSERHEISLILSTIDNAITATEKVIAKTEELKKGLMHDLLTKGIDDEGNLRSEDTHEFCEKHGMHVPVEWEVVKFSQVCKKALNGGTPSTKIQEYWEGTIPWITGADIIDQKVKEIRRHISGEAVENSATNVITKGNLLIVTRTGVGKVAIAPFDIAISQDITGIIPIEDVSTDYLFWTFNRGNDHFLNLNQGTSINGIKRKDLMNFSLSRPPLQEQCRIATILSAVDSDLSTERRHLACLKTLKKGLMQDLLTGRVRVPAEMANIGDNKESEWENGTNVVQGKNEETA